MDELCQSKQMDLLRDLFKITPKTCSQFWEIGLRTVADFRKPELTAHELYERFNTYGKKNNLWNGANAPRNYLTVFRRLLWTANATEEDRRLHPHMMTCKAWSKKAMTARGESVD
ncbi:hypothetical protein K493DRAFT_318359 [Basidiobolus meristosporus CBS 931.73]|uniref:Uncharacterized protein n=1 Tax=Basidiobolus meristosporus CBS 931.73 TaxID=1314790 RepID=A0A1Y1XVW7_9FUNG|nr:hypothetical protein K493DRAFT_318359 [Basidiobolus meristosporus CBS 931.73]|eukprot:ORX89898.1 hypothetical protein K493DRAFT_318359 [Basidiobolus meristosporus CBS 931.73]